MTKRKYRTDEEWLSLIQECRLSGLAEFLNLVIKVTRTDLMRLAPLLIRKSTQAALMNQRKPLHALIMTRFRQIWNPGCYSSLTVFHLNIPISRYMRTF